MPDSSTPAESAATIIETKSDLATLKGSPYAVVGAPSAEPENKDKTPTCRAYFSVHCAASMASEAQWTLK